MNDPLDAARTLLERGDLAGAERALAAAALEGPGDRDRAARALALLCERIGDVGLRAQQALDDFLARAPPGAENDDARARIRRVYESVGIVAEGAAAPHTPPPALPSLDGFSPPAAPDGSDTLKQERVQTLSDVAEAVLGGDAEVRDTARLDTLAVPDIAPLAPQRVPAPRPARTPPPPTPLPFAQRTGATPARTPGPRTSDAMEAFSVGAVVNERYEVLARIGRGGHATVLRVRDRELDEECALKVFHHSGDAADVARFKREVSISRKIVHENVVTLYDIGQEQGFYFLTMELLEGEDLSAVLKTRAVTMGQALGWLVDSCRGLQAAHDKGVVHRDVKPGNLFVLNDNRLKVTDFGIAKPADALSLTSTGMFVGTPQFVSPEQVQGHDVGTSADIYSLGVVAYLMLTGTLPFRDKEMVALLMKHATVTPDRPRSRNPRLPEALDELVAACLEKKAADRPASCATLADALERIRASLG